MNLVIPSTTMPVNVGVGSGTGGSSSISLSAPAGVTAGDLVFFMVFCDYSRSVSVSSNGGYTLQSIYTSPTAGERAYVFYGYYTGTQTSVTFSLNVSDHIVGAAIAYRNIKSLNYELFYDYSATTNKSVTSSLVAPPYSLVFLVSSEDTDTSTTQHSGQQNANLTGIIERKDVATSTGGGGGGQFVEGANATASAKAVGTWSWTLATASTTSGIILVASNYATVTVDPPAYKSELFIVHNSKLPEPWEV